MADFPANGFRIFKSTDGTTHFHMLLNSSVYPLALTDIVEEMEPGYYDEQMKPIDVRSRSDEFRESDHPRAEDGKFGNKSGSSGGSEQTSETPAAREPEQGKEGASETGRGGNIRKKGEVPRAHQATTLMAEKDDPKATQDTIIDQFEPEVRTLIQKAEERLAKATPTDAPVDKGGFKLPNGQYTPEREAMHQDIISKILSPENIKRAKPKPGEQATFVILGGRGGSGKSWLTREGGPVDAKKFIVFDNDKIKEKIPEYAVWNAAMVHEEATHVFERAEAAARELGLNVVHDATMKTTKNAEAFANKYRDKGYRVEGYYMFLPPQMAAKRAVERFVRAGRFVPPSYVLGSRSNEETFDKLRPGFDKWGLYDNSGDSPRYVASSDDEEKKD